jgi:hypothetical protein
MLDEQRGCISFACSLSSRWNLPFVDDSGEIDMRWVLIIVGIVLILLGGLWALQGVGILLGSPMTGQPRWLIIGTIVVIIGIASFIMGLRRRPASLSG